MNEKTPTIEDYIVTPEITDEQLDEWHKKALETGRAARVAVEFDASGTLAVNRKEKDELVDPYRERVHI